MKKIYSLFTFCTILSMLSQASARDFTYTYEGQTITYTVLDEEAKTCATKAGESSHILVGYKLDFVSAGNHVKGNLVLPSKPKDGEVEYTLEVIGDYSFGKCDSLTSVIIPNSVKKINYAAFEACTGINYLKIPESLQEISPYALYNSSIEKVEFPSIEYLCKKNYIKGVDANPLAYAKLLIINGEEITDLIIPESITTIGVSAFAGYKGLTSVKLHKNIETIEYSAFYACDNLQKAEFTSLEHLCKINFLDGEANPLSCAKHLIIDGKEMTEIEIPYSVTAIGQFAFYGYKGLKSITIGNSVTKIGDYAFSSCSNLSSVNLSNSIQSIGINAFGECTSLTSMIIPNSVIELGNSAFYNCSNLSSVNLSNSLKTIGDYTFYCCTALSSIVLHENMQTIGDYAFENCKSLTSVEFPNSVTTISTAAFGRCSGLTSLILPNSVETIGQSAFAGCKGLISIVIPNSVDSIGNTAFYNCNELKSIYYNTESPLICNAYLFYLSTGTRSDRSRVYNQATIYMPKKGIEKAKEMEPWKYFRNIQAYDFGGVEDIVAEKVGEIDYSAPYEIYNFNGVKVGNDKDALAPGLYIIRQGACTKKITIQ